MFEEVTEEERLEIDTRLYRAQRHFEDTRNAALYAKAQRLGEKFGGMLAHVTRYDLNEAEAFLTQHGFGRDTTRQPIAAAEEREDEWTSVDDALPTIPDGEHGVKVSVKLVEGEMPVNAFYLREVGTLSCPGSGFALEVPTKDINNRIIHMGSSSPLAPTHWRLRDQ